MLLKFEIISMRTDQVIRLQSSLYSPDPVLDFGSERGSEKEQ